MKYNVTLKRHNRTEKDLFSQYVDLETALNCMEHYDKENSFTETIRLDGKWIEQSIADILLKSENGEKIPYCKIFDTTTGKRLGKAIGYPPPYRQKGENMYKVIVDITPRVIKGTNGCHKYVFDSYKTRKEANRIANQINQTGTIGRATLAKEE